MEDRLKPRRQEASKRSNWFSRFRSPLAKKVGALLLPSGLLISTITLYFEWRHAEIQIEQLKLETAREDWTKEQDLYRLISEVCGLQDGSLLLSRLQVVRRMLGSIDITPAMCQTYRGSKQFNGEFVIPISATASMDKDACPDFFGFIGKIHPGVDFPGDTGDPVLASADGIVNFANSSGSFGKLVIIDHGDGWRTYYAHLQEITVSPGQIVFIKQRIGTVGSTGASTGPHVHFEIRKNGEAIDPVRRLFSHDKTCHHLGPKEILRHLAR